MTIGYLGVLIVAVIIAIIPVLIGTVFTSSKKNFRQRVDYRLGFGRVQYKLRAQVKFIVEAIVSGQIHPGGITYESMGRILQAAKVAFPMIDKDHLMLTPRPFALKEVLVNPFWSLSESLRAVKEVEALPPVPFVQEVFVLLSRSIAVCEAYPGENPKYSVARRAWRQASDSNISAIFEFRRNWTAVAAQVKSRSFQLKIGRKV